MIVDAGESRKLAIGGVFDGYATVMGQTIAFVPNRFERAPKDARIGVMTVDSGEIAIWFSDMTEEPNGAGLWSARWRRNP